MSDKQQVEGVQGGKVTLDLGYMLKATEQGLSRGSVALATGQSAVAVSRACKKWADQGVFLEKEKTGVRTDTAERAKEMLKAGAMAVREIAVELGVSPQRIYQIQKKGSK